MTLCTDPVVVFVKVSGDASYMIQRCFKASKIYEDDLETKLNK